MGMIRAGWLEYLRNLKRNLVLSLIVSVMAVVIVSLGSLYRQERSRMKPFQFLFDKADYVIPENNFGELPEDSAVETTYQMYRTNLDTSQGFITGYVYESWVYENWSPRLAEGTWISGASEEDLSIVIGGLTEGYSVGDTISLENGISCRIIGILAKDTEIIWKESGSYSSVLQASYNGYFGVPEISGKSGIYCILSREDAGRLNVPLTPSGGWSILAFRDDLTEAEKNAEEDTLFEATNEMGRPMSDFRIASEKQLSKKISGLLGISLVGGFLVLLLTGISTFVTIKESLKLYGIYRILGAGRLQCGLISYGNPMGILLVAAVCYRAEVLLISHFANRLNLIFKPGTGTGMLIGMCVLFLLSPIFGLVICFHKKYPLEMIREELS